MGSYVASSFTHLDPGSHEHLFEIERLQINYRAAQENLRVEQERSSAEQQLFFRERATREARHQQELEALRGQVSSEETAGKGKGRARR